MKTIQIRDTGSFDFVRLATMALNLGFSRKPPIEFQTKVVTKKELQPANFPNHRDGTRRQVNVGGMTQYGVAVAVIILVGDGDEKGEVPASITVGLDNKSMEYKFEIR